MAHSDQLLDAVIDVLGDRALSLAAVRSEIEQRELDPGRPDRHGIDTLGRVLQLAKQLTHFLDGRVAHTPTLMRGVSWTISIDDIDIERGFTVAENGLDVIFGWLMAGQETGGTRVVDIDGADIGKLLTDAFMIGGVDTDVAIWPQGALDSLDTRAATATILDATTLELAPVTEQTAPTEQQADAVRRAFDTTKRVQSVRALLTDAPVDIETATPTDVSAEMIVSDADVFREGAVPPLAALLAAAGLEQHHHSIGAIGTDWAAVDSDVRLRRTEYEYGLDRRQAEQFVLLTGAATARNPDDTLALGSTSEEIDGALALVATMLADATVAEAAWNHWSERGETGEGLSDIVDALSTFAPGEVHPGVLWFRARQAAMYDRTDEAIELLEAARADGASHSMVLADLAAFEADRSNPSAARTLLTQAGVSAAIDLDEDLDNLPNGFGAELADEIEPFVALRPRPMAGRNDACPCGSGRKYKQCHLGNELHPIEQRASWLYVKTMRFMELVAPRLVEAIADDIVDEILDPALRDMVIGSYMPTDLALHEGGLGVRFASAKAALLPADELSLIDAWNHTDRSVFEVVRSTADSMDVIDLASRERLTVRDTVPDEPLEAGWKMLGRLLPVADSVRAFGGFIPVNDDMIDPLIEAFATRKLETVAISIGQIFEAAEAQDEMQQLFDDSLDTSELESLIQSLSDD